MNYFIIVNGAQQGPYTIEELRQRHIDASTLVWAEGMEQWTPAWQVEELRTLFYDSTDNGTGATTTPPPMPGTANAAGNATANADGTTAGTTQYAQYAQGGTQGTAPNAQGAQPAKKPMKVWTWIGAAVVALLLVMAVSNPSRDEHMQVVKENISSGVEKGLSQSYGDSDNPFKAFGTAMVKAFATPFVNSAIDNLLQYHNYLFWSTTTIDLPDSLSKQKTVRTSLGIFGKVFTSDEDDIAKAISKAMNADGNTSTQYSDEDDVDDSDANTDGSSATDNDNDFATQVSDSVVSIGTKVGKSVAKKVSHEVSRELKKEIRQNTDSSTASGLGKIIDAVESFIKGL